VFPPSEQSSLSEGLEGLGAKDGPNRGKAFHAAIRARLSCAPGRQRAAGRRPDQAVHDVIEGLGGKVTKNEYWGVKSLNFRIRKNRKAHFTLLNVDAPPAALTEVERQQRINEDVLRYLTVRVDELEEGPSAMMRKVERDRERDERAAAASATAAIVSVVVADSAVTGAIGRRAVTATTIAATGVR
jgi:ribosomal protein S6